MGRIGTWIINSKTNMMKCPSCGEEWSINSKMTYCPACGHYNGERGNHSCADCWTHAHPCGYRNEHGYCLGFVTKEEGVKSMYKFALAESQRIDVDDEFRAVWLKRVEEIRIAAEKDGISLN